MGKIVASLLATSLALSAVPALAAVCLDDSGRVVPCPTARTVQGIFQPATFPRFAGVSADIYITGGNTIEGAGNFSIYANGQYLCNTSSQFYSSTPIRHCVGTITKPGTYFMTAVPTDGGNFKAPAPVVFNVD